jgi:Flp pilus assembly pilin Flp
MFKRRTFKALLSDQSGATAVEYSLVSGSMAIALVTAMPFITNGTDGIYGYIAELFDM